MREDADVSIDFSKALTKDSRPPGGATGLLRYRLWLAREHYVEALAAGLPPATGEKRLCYLRRLEVMLGDAA